MDPLAEKMPAWSPYHFVFNNPILMIDPDGRMPDCEGCPKDGKDGDTHEWAGARFDHYNGDWTHILQPVTVSAKAKYKDSFAYAMFGELAGGEGLGSDNPYLPYQGPDAISFQVNVGASGIFSEGGFSVGIAMSSSEIGVFGSIYGGSGISAPGIGLSVQMNFHHRTAGSGGILFDDFGGVSAGGSLGAGLIGGYSRSVESRGGTISPIKGFHNYSIGAGIGGGIPLGTRTSVSARLLFTYNKTIVL